MSKTYKVVVVGPSTMVGEAVLTLLDERGFPVSEMFAAAGNAGGRVQFKGSNIKVEPLELFDFSRVDIAFFCDDEQLAEEYVPKAAATGCVVIDDSPCFRLEDDVPLVVPEVNMLDLNGYSKQRIIANPSTCALMLATVLKPLSDAVGVKRVNAVTMQSVSGRDQAGVEELAKQTTAMFNLQTMEQDVFPVQIAFNLIPQIGDFYDDGTTGEEMKLLWESQKLLHDNELQVNATAVRVPVFHGHAMVLNIETAKGLSADEARSLLQDAAGIEVVDELEAGGYPTPVGDAVGHDAVFVGRIRKDVSHVNGLNLWVVADNVRKGAALNGVQIAEILIKEYMK